jgi:hypothetical protein
LKLAVRFIVALLLLFGLAACNQEKAAENGKKNVSTEEKANENKKSASKKQTEEQEVSSTDLVGNWLPSENRTKSYIKIKKDGNEMILNLYDDGYWAEMIFEITKTNGRKLEGKVVNGDDIHFGKYLGTDLEFEVSKDKNQLTLYLVDPKMKGKKIPQRVSTLIRTNKTFEEFKEEIEE